MRYDWYETKEKVTIVIYTKEALDYKLKEKNLTIKIGNYKLELNLYASVSDISVAEYACKKEIILDKSVPMKWGSLDRETAKEGTRNLDKMIDKIEISDDGDKNAISFLQNLYQRSNDDVKRAMNKSFIESKGTVLKTQLQEEPPEKEEKMFNK